MIKGTTRDWCWFALLSPNFLTLIYSRLQLCAVQDLIQNLPPGTQGQNCEQPPFGVYLHTKLDVGLITVLQPMEQIL